LKRHIKLFFDSIGLELSKHIAYKTNFILKILANASADVIAPLFALLIYQNTSGIPGWSFEQYILLTGTLILVSGIGHVFTIKIPMQCIDAIRNGSFDAILTRPFNTLTYLTLTSVDIDGIGSLFTGLFLIIWAYIKLDLGFSMNLVWYLLFLGLAVLFEYSIYVLIAALAFIFVKSWALFQVVFQLKMFAKYPTTIYNPKLQFLITFIIPVAMTAFYPVDVLLNGLRNYGMLWVCIPVIGFYAFTLLVWRYAMKKYTSAGG
jgi:ABC-2 type transport system permease protein